MKNHGNVGIVNKTAAAKVANEQLMMTTVVTPNKVGM